MHYYVKGTATYFSKFGAGRFRPGMAVSLVPLFLIKVSIQIGQINRLHLDARESVYFITLMDEEVE